MSEDTFRWVVAGGVGIAALFTAVMAVAMILVYRIASKVKGNVDEVMPRVTTLLETVDGFAQENAPKLNMITTRAREIADNAKEISDVARDQAHRFAEVGRDVADRAKAQVARVDAAVDETVEQVQNAGANLKTAARKPIREAEGVIAGVKAAMSSYAQGRRPSVDHVTQDEEMFI
ncbi:MAG: hypothetical protein KGN84_14600 [Acidobacteriota bacterium]|nr:hypothetical protein [Acidobacteriota bacterium]